jgi:hypothetical protein
LLHRQTQLACSLYAAPSLWRATAAPAWTTVATLASVTVAALAAAQAFAS